MATAEPESGTEPIGPLSAEVEAALTMDPFARHRRFAKVVEAGRTRSKLFDFLDGFREPIDVRADKILDLSKFGQPLHPFVKAPRVKKKEEFNDDLDDRMKTDLERQFILRNLMRYVKTVDKDDPLEFTKKAIELANMDIDARAHIAELHTKPALLDELGVDHVREELAWRRKYLEIMQWERYFCREIKEDFAGPIWKHDPETNPVRTKQADQALEQGTIGTAGDGAGG